MSQAYPLQWPHGWPRTDALRRESARFKVTLHSALTFLQDELRRLGAKDVVLSSDCTLGQQNPKDSGVCAYFHYQGINAAIPCDRWRKVEDNVQAIAKTVEAMRGIERWGAKNMIKAAFSGFAALPAPGKTSRDWRMVLELNGDATLAKARENYRRLASLRHPDKGGSTDAMAELNMAWQQAQEALA